MTDAKQRFLWGFSREELIESITQVCSFISEDQVEIIRQLPYDALDALFSELRSENNKIIRRYMRSKFVTATRKNGEVMRGLLTDQYPASESGERVFIDYEGKAWDLTNFASMDTPLSYGGDQEPTGARGLV